mmetsp:Transcript_35457/g.85792  ORF Transcript_35457/g.85792 Transcript_35457/m.85792 type:complete len:185 (+) Transcript_35457:744-1298(+)
MMWYIDQDTIKEFNWSEIANASGGGGGETTATASFGTPPSTIPLSSFFFLRGVNRGGSSTDHLMMILWTIGVVSYLVLLSPLVFVSIFFWIVAVEFGLHTILLKSTFQYPATDDDLHSTYSESSNHEEEIEQEQEDLLIEETKTNTETTKPTAGNSWRTTTTPEVIRVRAEEAKDYEFTMGPFS